MMQPASAVKIFVEHCCATTAVAVAVATLLVLQG